MLTRQREVFPLFSLLLIISIWRPSLATRQQLSILDCLLVLLVAGDVVWLDQVQPETSWEVQGFPEFVIYPEKAPVGKLHRSFSGYTSGDTAVVLLLLGCSWLPQCDGSVFFLQEKVSLTSPFLDIKERL